jgi:hypothetical protein
MRFFRKNAYGLNAFFVTIRITIHHAKILKINLKKNVEKKGFSFFETLFLK